MARPRAAAGERSNPSPDLDVLAEDLRVLANGRRIRLLHFLVAARTIEEMASELGIARQNAQEHLQQLLDLGVVQRVPGRGPSSRFVVAPAQLFRLQEEFGRLGALQPAYEREGVVPTQHLGSAPAAPRERDLPRLVLVRGPRLGWTEALSGPGPWLLGRDAAAAVNPDYDPFVSARHAEVRRAGAGFELADLYSSNGTFLDWVRLARGGAAGLDNGAVIGIGRSIFVFRKPA